MVSSFKQWWAQPFNSNGSAWNWALFILLLMVFAILWSQVIGIMFKAGESVAEAVA